MNERLAQAVDRLENKMGMDTDLLPGHDVSDASSFEERLEKVGRRTYERVYDGKTCVQEIEIPARLCPQGRRKA